MKVANVVPESLLGVSGIVDESEKYHLCLAELVNQSSGYADFYWGCGQRGNYVILDNGAYEFGKTPSLESLIRAAHRIMPSEIVLPDAMFGPECAVETVTMSCEGQRALSADGFTNFMAVPHGNTRGEWVWCAKQLVAIPGVKCLGIAEKDAIKLANGDRALLAEILQDTCPGKDIHYLGMMEDMLDVCSPWSRENVRGVDGSKLVVWGMNRCLISPGSAPPVYPGRPDGFLSMTEPLSENQANAVRYNIQIWRAFAHDRRIK